MNNFQKLKEEILLNSFEKEDFQIAKYEWELYDIKDIKNSVCACGHNPIRECCFIINTLNDISLLVGNCCIKKFQNLPICDWYFQGLKRIRVLKNPNHKMIQYLYGTKILNLSEYIFLKSIHGKKKYTTSQKIRQKAILIKLKNLLINKKLEEQNK